MDGRLTVESCSKCRFDAVVHQAYSGQHLCGNHLASSIRKRISRELRLQLVLPKDATREDGFPFRILVAISGGKDSAVLLSMMADIIGQRRDVELIAGCVDEGRELGCCHRCGRDREWGQVDGPHRALTVRRVGPHLIAHKEGSPP